MPPLVHLAPPALARGPLTFTAPRSASNAPMADLLSAPEQLAPPIQAPEAVAPSLHPWQMMARGPLPLAGLLHTLTQISLAPALLPLLYLPSQ
jgi:hypothetical protein